MYYLQSRYYNPTLGRFINADTYAATGQDLIGNNMFAYCGNNPVARKDSSGTAYVFLAEYMTEVDPDGPFDETGGGGGYGLGVKPSFYTSQRVQSYDSNWQNSSHNQNSTSFGGSENPSTSSIDFENFSTGRTTPRNLIEKLAMDSAKSDPAEGNVIIQHLKDPRLTGFSKYSRVYETSIGIIEIHYVGNKGLNIYFDFKFK